MTTKILTNCEFSQFVITTKYTVQNVWKADFRGILRNMITTKISQLREFLPWDTANRGEHACKNVKFIVFGFPKIERNQLSSFRRLGIAFNPNKNSIWLRFSQTKNGQTDLVITDE